MEANIEYEIKTNFTDKNNKFPLGNIHTIIIGDHKIEINSNSGPKEDLKKIEILNALVKILENELQNVQIIKFKNHNLFTKEFINFYNEILELKRIPEYEREIKFPKNIAELFKGKQIIPIN